MLSVCLGFSYWSLWMTPCQPGSSFLPSCLEGLPPSPVLRPLHFIHSVLCLPPTFSWEYTHVISLEITDLESGIWESRGQEHLIQHRLLTSRQNTMQTDFQWVVTEETNNENLLINWNWLPRILHVDPVKWSLTHSTLLPSNKRNKTKTK